MKRLLAGALALLACTTSFALADDGAYRNERYQYESGQHHLSHAQSVKASSWTRGREVKVTVQNLGRPARDYERKEADLSYDTAANSRLAAPAFHR